MIQWFLFESLHPTVKLNSAHMTGKDSEMVAYKN